MKKWFVVFTLMTLLLAALLGACHPGGKSDAKEVNLLNWSEYMPQSVLDQFEEEYGIKVNYSEMSSNEEMLAKISAGGSGYDITVATDYMVDIMLKQDLLEKIDKSAVTNRANIGSEFLTKEFDQEGDYFIPYMWGNVVIAVNTDKVKTEVGSFKDLWKPEFKNALVVPDDMRSLIGVANKVQGKSLNETDVTVLEESKKLLQELQANIKAYDSDSPKTMLVNGEALAGIVWGGEASLARQENPAIQTVLPSEGMELWQDNFVIPKGAPHKKEAELFINFILRPEISAEISKEFPYANPNLAAHEFIDANILNDPAVYTPEAAKARSEFMTDLGAATREYDRIWSEIKQ
jgi:spermidine/putrescine transport system permease protein